MRTNKLLSNWLIIALYVFCNLVCSCNPTKQAVRRAAKEARKEAKKLADAKAVFNKDPLEFALDCGRAFPPRAFDSSNSETELAKGKLIDSLKNTFRKDITAQVIALLQKSGDSSVQHIIDSLKDNPIIVEGDCPPTYIYAPDTMKTKTTKFRTEANTAVEEGLRKENKTLVAQAATEKQHSKDLEGDKATLKHYLIGSAAGNLLFLILIIVFIVLKIKGKISFL